MSTTDLTSELIQIAAETFGNPDDDAIVLVMGATASMLWWPIEMCGTLVRAGFHVISYDHRDTGRSTTGHPGVVDYSAEDLTADLIGVLDALDIGAAHLVGMSLGGYISQIAALRYPDRVLSLTLIGSEPLGSTDELPGIDDKFMTHFAGMGELDWSDDAAVEEFLVEMADSAPEHRNASTRRAPVNEFATRSPERSTSPAPSTTPWSPQPTTGQKQSIGSRSQRL